MWNLQYFLHWFVVYSGVDGCFPLQVFCHSVLGKRHPTNLETHPSSTSPAGYFGCHPGDSESRGSGGPTKCPGQMGRKTAFSLDPKPDVENHLVLDFGAGQSRF